MIPSPTLLSIEPYGMPIYDISVITSMPLAIKYISTNIYLSTLLTKIIYKIHTISKITIFNVQSTPLLVLAAVYINSVPAKKNSNSIYSLYHITMKVVLILLGCAVLVWTDPEGNFSSLGDYIILRKINYRVHSQSLGDF